MTIFQQIWQKLDRRARLGMASGLIIIVVGMVALSFWVFRQDYQVLFSGLSSQDASAMVAELDKMKVPYQLDNHGETILVSADTVHKTRLQLLSRDIPLHGAVGFELFNNSDFGMTDFAQKVNYQRALQGEITRTILSIEDIQAARVHLAFPEQGLFKKATAQSKASVTVTLKPGRTLLPEQVRGIQRLVGASVAEIRPEDVTVLDQHGVALTRAGSVAAELDGTGDRLDQKRGLEDYLAKKVTEVLDRSFGQGQAIASVDVLFDEKRLKQTTENILPADSSDRPGARVGVVVKQRSTHRERGEGNADEADAGSSHEEVEYQVGRRVEQVERGPGSIERLGVSVVLRQAMDEAQLAKLREIVGNAVGFNAARGDSLAVYTVGQIAANNAAPAAAKSVDEITLEKMPAPAASPATNNGGGVPLVWFGAVVFVGLLALVALLSRRGPAMPALAVQQGAAMDPAERERSLAQIKAWLAQDAEAAQEQKGQP